MSNSAVDRLIDCWDKLHQQLLWQLLSWQRK